MFVRNGNQLQVKTLCIMRARFFEVFEILDLHNIFGAEQGNIAGSQLFYSTLIVINMENDKRLIVRSAYKGA